MESTTAFYVIDRVSASFSDKQAAKLSIEQFVVLLSISLSQYGDTIEKARPSGGGKVSELNMRTHVDTADHLQFSHFWGLL